MVESHQESYRIFCLFVDEENPFSIFIKKSALVDDLKKRIKEERNDRLANIGANLLTLYQVEIADDEHALKNVTLKELFALRPTKKLEFYFPSTPKDEIVHIIIEPPPLGKSSALAELILLDINLRPPQPRRHLTPLLS